MLDKFREGVKSPWAKIILGLVIASFVFAGIGSYLVGGSPNIVAKVNGSKISRQAYEREFQLARQQMGAKFKLYYNSEARVAKYREQVLDRMIMRKLYQQFAQELGLKVGMDTVLAKIRAIPQFQVGNKFNATTFRRLLSRSGQTPEGFVRSSQQRMTMQQLVTLDDSEFSLPGEINQQLGLQGQTRDGYYLFIQSRLLAASIGFEGEKGEQELKTYYKTHIDDYRVPEKVSVKYVDLDGVKLQKTLSVTDKELQTYYKAHEDKFGLPEQRKVSHILIAVSKTAKPAAIAAARKKLEAIQTRITAGANFAAEAKANSEDPGSAQNGGDMGYFSHGVDPAFDRAAFALAAVGDVSAIIRSKFGFHLLKLTGIKKATIKPFAKVKAQVEAGVRKDKVDVAFAEKNDLLTEKAFEFTDSLDEVAQAVGLKVHTSVAFARSGGRGIFAKPAAVAAAFSDAVLTDGYNSDVVSLGVNHSLVVRLAKHQDSYVKPFKTVRRLVTAALTAEKARIKASEMGEAILNKLKSGILPQQALQSTPTALKLAWISFKGIGREDRKVPTYVRVEIFDAAPPGATASVKGLRAGGGYLLVYLTGVKAAAPGLSTPKQRKQVSERMTREMSNRDDLALQQWLKSNADISRQSVGK